MDDRPGMPRGAGRTPIETRTGPYADPEPGLRESIEPIRLFPLGHHAGVVANPRGRCTQNACAGRVRESSSRTRSSVPAHPRFVTPPPSTHPIGVAQAGIRPVPFVIRGSQLAVRGWPVGPLAVGGWRTVVR
jgi:hypothetical protein